VGVIVIGIGDSELPVIGLLLEISGGSKGAIDQAGDVGMLAGVSFMAVLCSISSPKWKKRREEWSINKIKNKMK